MQARHYWQDKKSSLANELQGLNGRTDGNAFSPKEWKKFDKNARGPLAAAYAKMCAQIVDQVRRKRSLDRNGLNELGDLLSQQGTLRFVSYIGQAPDGASHVLGYPMTWARRDWKKTLRYHSNGPEWGYGFRNIKPTARQFGATYVSLDLNGIKGHSIAYRDGVSSASRVKCTRAIDGLKLDITDIVESALHETSEGLLKWINLFGAVAFGQIQHDELEKRIKAAHAAIRMADQCSDLWTKVHLPDKVLLEIFQTMESFSDPYAKVGAVLLKGVPGTGKTFLAATIAQSVGAHFIKAGVTTLKQTHLGESAQAVKNLWKEARTKKPCVVFVDECDSVFAKRGSHDADVIVAEITNAFLTEWNGQEPGIWIIAATNRSDSLDDGILSRFDAQIEIPLPDTKAREAILTQELYEAGYRGTISPDITSLTQGMSGRDLAQIAQKAARQSAGMSLASLITGMRSAGNHAVDADATWDSLILDAATMEKLKTTCGMLQDVEAWRDRGVHVANGMLLEGPPGTGKTQIARTIANESHLAFVNATTADLHGQYLGHSAHNVKNLFEKARSMSPSILFIDELDICAPVRGAAAVDSFSKEIIGQLLQEMSGIESSSCLVFVLAATNHRDLIDPAVLRRFTETLYIPLPDLDARTRLLKVMLAAAKVNFSADQIATLAGACEGMSGADLKNWITRAQQKAVARAMVQGGASNYDLGVADFVETAAVKR